MVELSESERVELLAMLNSTTVSARVATRARIVLWRAEGWLKKDVASRAGVSRPTVDAVLERFAADGVAGLLDKPVKVVQPDRVPAQVRARILAVTRCSPPRETGLSHWSSRELSGFLKRTEGISVSHNYIATLWREHGLKPWRVGTFKLSRDPAFAEKVGDIVGLYLAPPGGAVVLSIDEKTQVQALDRTQPTLPLDCGKVEKKTHDYIRHGTTNLFAALNVVTGEVFGECCPTRNGQDFLNFLKKAVRPHAGKEIRIVLDNLSTHHARRSGLAGEEPERHFPLHAGRLVVAQSNRNLVWNHHPPGDQTGNLHLGARPHRADRRLYQQLERQPKALHMDCDCR
jgi:transposase